MLQQTQAARVAVALPRFLERYPTPVAMAAAAPADVIRDWAGLGYNRRAVRLHACATAIVERHDGAVPDGLDALLALPGLGPYSARAVAAFAFGADVGPVDVNVARVLARAVAGAPLRGRALQALADRAVPGGSGRAWSSALMDLGAVVCRARAPRCDACPLAARCRWRTAGGQDPAAGSSARARPQGAFEGSTRQRRGRLLEVLRAGPVDAAALVALLGSEATATAAALVADGLAVERDGLLRLP